MPSFPSQTPKDECPSHALLWLCRGRGMEQSSLYSVAWDRDSSSRQLWSSPPQRTLVPHAAHLSHMSKFV